MKKIKRFIFAIILIIPVIVFASDADHYTLTLSVSPGNISSVGKYKYKNDNYSAIVEIKNVINANNPQKIVIALDKYSMLGTSVQVKRLPNLNAKKGTQTIYAIGNYGSGYANVHFGTFENAFSNNSNKGQIYSGFMSDYVTIKTTY